MKRAGIIAGVIFGLITGIVIVWSLSRGTSDGPSTEVKDVRTAPSAFVVTDRNRDRSAPREHHRSWTTTEG